MDRANVVYGYTANRVKLYLCNFDVVDICGRGSLIKNGQQWQWSLSFVGGEEEVTK